MKPLILLAALGAALSGVPSAEAQTMTPARVPFDSRHFLLERLAGGVWAAIQNDEGGWAICNGGIIDLGDRTVVVDPFMTPEAARDLKRAAEQLTGRPVTLVINTHRHNDHVRGNQVFLPGAEILGTSTMRRQILEFEPADIAAERRDAPARLAQMEALAGSTTGAAARDARMFVDYHRGMLASHPELVTTPPTLVTDTNMVIRGSARALEVRLMGRGHTDSDLVVVLPGEGVVFMGDLLFVERHPWLADGSPTGLVAALRQVQGWGLATFVPGHGPVAGAGSVATMLEYVATLEGMVRGKTPDQAAALAVPPAYEGWPFRMFYAANLGFLASLSR